MTKRSSDKNQGEIIARKQIYSSGEVAKMFGVAARTMVKWANRGALKCFRLPFSRDRRFKLEDILAFSKEQGIVPIYLDSAVPVLLMVGLSHQSRNEIIGHLPDWIIHTCDTGFDAACMLTQHNPDVVLVDEDMGTSASHELARNLARVNGRSTLLLSNPDHEPPQIESVRVFVRPFVAGDVCRVIATIAERGHA